MKCQYLQSMEVYYKNIIADYRDYFDDLLVEIDLDPKYKYKPNLFAAEKYGTPDLYFMVLYLANVTSAIDFVGPKIKMLPVSKIDLFNRLQTHFNAEIVNNKLYPDVYNALPIMSDSNDGALIQEAYKMKKTFK
jgi:hypothetical protein